MSKYGEVKDLLDKIKMFSNLRIQAFDDRFGRYGISETTLKGDSSFRREADEVLKEIEKDLDNLVTDRIISKHELIHRIANE